MQRARRLVDSDGDSSSSVSSGRPPSAQRRRAAAGSRNNEEEATNQLAQQQAIMHEPDTLARRTGVRGHAGSLVATVDTPHRVAAAWPTQRHHIRNQDERQFAALRSAPQIVLQNPGAMVVYDPPAHELVVYQQPPLLDVAQSPSPTTGDRGVEASESPVSITRQLQPFNQSFDQEFFRMDEAERPPACRLCHRPFGPWDSYTRDADQFEFGGSMDASGSIDPNVRRRRRHDPQHFTSNDYFHLLAATEQAADASREHDTAHLDEEQESVGSDTSRSSRTRRRPLRGVDGDEVKEHPTRHNLRSSGAVVEDSDPISSQRQGPRSRSGRGVHIRRQSGPHLPSSVRISASSSTEDLVQEGVRPGRASSTASAADDDHAVAEDSAEEEDEVLECGLRRSSFNSGYYAKFFREDCKLGSGGVGGVYLTHHVLDNVMLGTYAVKKIPVGNSRPWLVQVLKEVRALEGLHHRHIVAYKHSWLENFKPSDFGPEVPCLFLLMEYANKGTLADRIWPKIKSGSAATGAGASARRVGGLPVPHIMPEEDVWCIFIGTLLGLRHLHRAGCIHRDLKPENLLLQSDVDALGRDRGGLRVLVSDFGNAILKGVPYARTGNTGTLAYSAPETLIPRREFAARFGGSQTPTPSPTAATMSGTSRASPISASPVNGSSLAIAYDEACDLWSAGVILYAMAFGKLPFFSNSPEALFVEIQQNSQGTAGLHLPTHVQRSPEMLRMIRELLSLDPAQRPGLDELLNRPAIQQRRQQRYAEAQQFQRPSRPPTQASYSERAESYRPPPNALVISPMLGAVMPKRGARSVSPAPIALGTTLPDVPTPPRRRHSSIELLPATPSDASGALVSISLLEEDAMLPPALALVQSALDVAFRALAWMAPRLTGYASWNPGSCWRCQWSVTAETMVHLAAFFLKLWLSLSVLLRFPSASSMYLHVFPQVFLTLALVVAAVATHPFLRFSSASHPLLKRTRRRVQLWNLDSSPWRWHLTRLALSVAACLLSVYWLQVSDASPLWHIINVCVMAGGCSSILCTFFSSHPSHTSLHPSRGGRARTRSPIRRGGVGRGMASPPSGLPSVPPTDGDATPPQRLVVHTHGTVVARVPLLLPPVTTPQADTTPTPASSSRRRG